MIKRTIVMENHVRLSMRLGQMVVVYPEVAEDENMSSAIRQQSTKTVPIEDIGVLVLDNRQISITQALLSELVKQNIAVITCDDKHMPIGLLMPLEGNTLQSERFREQIDASEPLRKQMWQQTVSSKIKGQAAVLKSQNVTADNMMVWANSVRSGDADNLEGRAAAYYWKNVFHDPDFIRDPEGLPPNNLLNYGYAVLRALVARSLTAVGLLPTLGIHHHNRYNAYCLADDIMEPYRPIVDQVVLDICSKTADVSTLTSQLKVQLYALCTREIMIDGHRSPLMVAVQTTAQSVQKCFSGESRKIIYPDW